eukprot:TRINITY_DN16710_c0_g1_i2.p2 TRINITY_DN16710_c0_g1~~TRINITY_DN16710_c0_g1_i2.p2  ORF type:complete len:547 (+),score=64.31 TRINITY_DN16710_c0_g1_i2:49-1641(+)
MVLLSFKVRQLVSITTLLVTACQCAVHIYQGAYFNGVGEYAFLFQGGREGLYRSKTVALQQEYQEETYLFDYYNEGFGEEFLLEGIANGESYIKFDEVKFSRSPFIAQQFKDKSQDEITGKVFVVVFELQDRHRIGIQTATGTKYCCSEELSKETNCESGSLIYKKREDDEDWPWVSDAIFIGNRTDTYAYDDSVVIKQTGMYYLWFIACGRDMTGLLVTGTTVWKNPYGYLPGMMQPNLQLFGFLALSYVILFAIWTTLYIFNWKDIIALQHCISAAIVLGLVEMSTWYFDYVTFNHSGYRPYGTTIAAVVLGSVRKAFSRVVVLLVAMGYGTIRPTLGDLNKKVLFLGVVYLLAILAYDVTSNVGKVDDFNGIERLLLILPVAILDVVMFLWIFTALSRTLIKLQTKNQGAKLSLYRKFTNAIIFVVWVGALWLGYEVWFRFSDPDNEKWRYEYVCNGFWYVLNLVFLMVICFLFTPSASATRFAYKQEDLEEDYTFNNNGKKRPQINTDVFALDIADQDDEVVVKKE